MLSIVSLARGTNFGPLFFAIVLCSFSSASARGTTQTTPIDVRQMFRPVDEMRLKAEMPGLAISTFTSQGTQFNFASGSTTIGTNGQPMSSSSILVPVASISKLFTAVSIFQMIDRGTLKLDTTLSQLPRTLAYQVVQSQCPAGLSRLRKIKIRHLLSHQAGINQDTPGANLWWDVDAIRDQAYPTRADFASGFCSTELLFEPGTAPLYKYSNAGFNLLSQIVAAYGGYGTFEDYVAANILIPLGMNQTFYTLSQAQARNQLTSSHGNIGTDTTSDPRGRLVLPKVLHPETYEGSIGVNSTAEDLARFGAAMMDWSAVRPSANSDSVRALRRMWEDMLYPVSRSSKTASISHGFMILDTKSSTYSFHATGFICYGHTGTGYGSRSILFICPELDWGFVGLFNTRDTNREDFLRLVSQILFDKGLLKPAATVAPEVQHWAAEAREFHADTVVVPLPKPAKADTANIPADLREFVGTYFSGVVGNIEVSVSVNGKLMVRDVEIDQEGPGQFRYPVNAGSSDVREPVRFIRECGNGRVIGLNQAFVLFAAKKLTTPLIQTCP